MNNIPSVLLIDGEISFYQPLTEFFDEEIKAKLFKLSFASTGQQGLKEARKIIEQNNTLLIIETILPYLSGAKLLEILDKEKSPQSNAKAIILSASATNQELQKLKEKYDWIIDGFQKPIDCHNLKKILNSLYGKLPDFFDYEQLDKETAIFIKQKTKEIRLWKNNKTILKTIETGKKIIQIQSILNQEQFKIWIKFESELHHTTLFLIRRVAKVFGQNKERISHSGLKLPVLFLISSKTFSSEMREEIIQLSEQGKILSYQQVRDTYR